MKIKIWGARGSVPVPGPGTVKYGGNTSCCQVTTSGGGLIIFDGGTGIRVLGAALHGRKITGHIFFTHMHWDHIQGFPFFDPAYVKGNRFFLYGERKFKLNLEDALSGQMEYPNFPVQLEEMGAEMIFRDLLEFEKVRVGGAVVSCIKGNHPGGAFIFKVAEKGKTFVYATDNEHYSCIPPKLLDFTRGADVLIYDTMFTDEEYCGGGKGRCRASWGHSTVEEGVKLAKIAGVKRLILWHHDPSHDDSKIGQMERWAAARFPGAAAASEGLEIKP